MASDIGSSSQINGSFFVFDLNLSRNSETQCL